MSAAEVLNILTLIAVLSGPIIAVQLTRYLDEQKDRRNRKLLIFKTLMATRASSLSPSHVEALNLIDLEFNPDDRREEGVIDAWKAYLDLLSDERMPPDQWLIRRVDLLVELLHQMALVLGFHFDKVTIKNSSYYPKLHGEVEQDQHAIRRALKDLLEGRRPIPVSITPVIPSGGRVEAAGLSKPVV